MNQKNRILKEGFTTGTSAAAAAKCALSYLLTGKTSDSIQITLLTGEPRQIEIHSCILDSTGAICTVIKDAGDDPDVTHGAEIGAKVIFDPASENSLIISGGKGVGMITKPGLEMSPGKWAINPGPLKMISNAIQEVLGKHQKKGRVHVIIFVINGEKIAQKTLNARLGIVGGISILGTTGIVKPMSHDAYIATIASSLSVAKANGVKDVVFTTGRRSERFAKLLFSNVTDLSFIQMGDFFKSSIEYASEKGFDTIILCVFFGKALKMAQGIPHTHATTSSICLNTLSNWTKQLTGNRLLADKIAQSHTAREALQLLQQNGQYIIRYVGNQMIRSAESFLTSRIPIIGVIFDFDGNVIFDSRAL